MVINLNSGEEHLATRYIPQQVWVGEMFSGLNGKLYFFGEKKEAYQGPASMNRLPENLELVEYDPELRQFKTIANTRRNPSETPLDKPLLNNFRLRTVPDESCLLVQIDQRQYRYYPATGNFEKGSNPQNASSLVVGSRMYHREFFADGKVWAPSHSEIKSMVTDSSYIAYRSHPPGNLRSQLNKVIIQSRIRSDRPEQADYVNYAQRLEAGTLHEYNFGFREKYGWVIVDMNTRSQNDIIGFFELDDLVTVLNQGPEESKLLE